ncbi:hypothetical protein Pcinc_033679 [Petrolisthes cinctipes]|uniref:Uncharacterized protein n=1 Tax=Petrolisthes cinctipes TaxID=88211 RepID=A0AAE1ERY2_PETCI|nr:hypothetical protein Pcinc_033679 [Petrolisthes cinctipes]
MNLNHHSTPPMNFNHHSTPAMNLNHHSTPPMNLNHHSTPPMNLNHHSTPPMNLNPTQTIHPFIHIYHTNNTYSVHRYPALHFHLSTTTTQVPNKYTITPTNKTTSSKQHRT